MAFIDSKASSSKPGLTSGNRSAGAGAGAAKGNRNGKSRAPANSRVKSNTLRREKHDGEIAELQARIDSYEPKEIESFEQLPLSSKTVKGEF